MALSTTRPLVPVGAAGAAHVGAGPRFESHTATPRVLCWPGLCCPTASSLLRPDPPVSPSPLALLAACTSGLATTRPSLLWDTDHSPDATTHVPEQAPTALARCLRRCPSAFAHAGMGSAARLATTRFSWLAVSTLQCSLFAAASGFARPPDGSDRSPRPRGLLSELAPSPVARRECQTLLRSRTGQLLRRDLHPRGRYRYRLHPAHGLPGGLQVEACATPRILNGAAQADEPEGFEEGAIPRGRPTSGPTRPRALHEQPAEATFDVLIQVRKLVRRVARTKVLPPAPKHRIECPRARFNPTGFQPVSFQLVGSDRLRRTGERVSIVGTTIVTMNRLSLAGGAVCDFQSRAESIAFRR